MRNPCYPLTPAAGGGKMGATLARVISAWSGLLWYNTHCTQKPPHTCVQVTLARETGPECGAACVIETKEKTRVVSVWPPVTTRASVA
jgi:hypothetical protein